MHHLTKWFFITLGALSVIAGLITVWMPIPVGIPLMLIGLPLLMNYSPNARRWIIHFAEKFPKLKALLNRFKWTRVSENQSKQHNKSD